jgi:hypothetical protein
MMSTSAAFGKPQRDEAHDRMLEHGLGAAAEPDVESAAELESAGE